ncbi:hypothetical protein [Hydrogenimonas urashimensis]|uniref:hypothetical protein n=1 Tax=Hydrogenimonas urashimensis TaxID=2740515 RepID=UPI0019150194|nr:hypothetical protein [Hydrogenimonas urashimensis]
MTYEKPWYQSKGVWGGIVSILAIVLGVFGYTVSPEDQQAIVVALTSVGATVGSVVAIYGRIKATKRVR